MMKMNFKICFDLEHAQVEEKLTTDQLEYLRQRK